MRDGNNVVEDELSLKKRRKTLQTKNEKKWRITVTYAPFDVVFILPSYPLSFLRARGKGRFIMEIS